MTGDNNGLDWNDATWNPVRGCTSVSPGCDHCQCASNGCTRSRRSAARQGVPFLFRSRGGVQRELTGPMLDGKTWEQFPVMPTAVESSPWPA